MGKTATPNLKGATKEADEIKKRLDKVRKECETLTDPTLKDRDEKMKQAYADCVDLTNDMSELKTRINSLKQVNDPVKVLNYDRKKSDELKRLEKMMTQLSELKKSVEPDDTEDDYLRKMKADLASEEKRKSPDAEEVDEYDSEEEGEDESELEEEYEEESEEEEEEGEQEPQIQSKQLEYEAIASYTAQETGDLDVSKGDIVTLVVVRDDGWWECENADGERGLLPQNYLKEYIPYKELMTEEAEQPDDSQTTEPTTPRTGKALWKGLKKAVSETSATDVLSALGAVPAGFREPTSANLLKLKDETHNSVNFLYPKLSTSNLFYKDLRYDATANKVMPKNARLQKIVSLYAVKNMPLPGTGSRVISRLARVSLFDGSKILTNIVTVQADCTDKEGKNWIFPDRNLRTLESRDCFVRIAEPTESVGILVELSMIFCKEKNPTQVTELSCGWAFLPMFNDTHKLILNKEYEVQLNGGTPYERNVEVDPTIARRVASSKLMSMISRNKQPVVILKTSAANDEQKIQLDSLPSVIAGKLNTLQMSSLYRYRLACCMIRDRENLQSAEVVHDAFLQNYPLILEQHDLIDVLKEHYDAEIKKKSRNEKKDLDILTNTLVNCFTQYVYPLLHIRLSQYQPGYPDMLLVRKSQITTYLLKVTAKQSVLAAMLDPEIEYEPFDIQEVSFNVMNRHCITTV